MQSWRLLLTVIVVSWPVGSLRVQAQTGTPPSSKVFKAHVLKVQGVAISPDGKLMATAGTDLAIVWDLSTARPKFRLDPEGGDASADTVAFAPDGATLAVGGAAGGVYLWDTATGKLSATLDQRSSGSPSLVYSPDGALLATTHENTDVMVFDIKARKVLATIRGGDGNIKSLGISSDGKTLVTITEETLATWDLATYKLRQSVKVDGAGRDLACFQALACSPARPILAVTGGPLLETKTALCDVNSLKRKIVLPAPRDDTHPPEIACFSPDGKTLATAADVLEEPHRWAVTLWNVSSGRPFALLEGPDKKLTQIAFSRTGDLVAASVSSGDRDVVVWEAGKKGSASSKTRSRMERKAR